MERPVGRSVPLLALLVAACATAPKPPPPAEPQAPEPAAPVERPDPWNEPPFSADPDHLLRAAAALPPPPDATAEAILAEATIYLAPAGDLLSARRVIRTLPRLAPGQGSIAIGWNPLYEDRPELRARAIWPDGTVRWMEPIDFDDVDAGDGTRALRTELPVEPGMVIEQFSSVRLHPAASGGGRLPFSAGMPTRQGRIAVSADPDVPVRAIARGIAARPKDLLADGRRVIAFEAAPVPVPAALPFPPPELETAPAVEWTTATSWADAVGPAADAVQAAIAADPAALTPLLRGVDRLGPPKKAAATILGNLRRRVTILDGAAEVAALSPGLPAQTLAAKRARPLDAATVLAAALRATGIPADLALVRESGPDPLPEFPVLHGRYRVLVALPDGTFLDPAYPEAPSLPVPAAVEGRLAVRLSREDPGPVPVPALPAAASRSAVTREIRFPANGPARIFETIEGTGHVAAAYRAAWAEGGLAHFRATVGDLEGWALGGKAEHVRVDPGAPGRPFRARFEVPEARGAIRAPGEATVRLPPTALFFRLPLAEEVGRTADVVLPFAHVAELRTVVLPPAGLVPAEPLAVAPLPFGPLTVRREASAKPGRVQLREIIEVDRRRFSPGEVDAMIEDAARLTLSSELRLVAPNRAASR